MAELGRQDRHDERFGGALGVVAAVSSATLTDASQKMGGTGLILDSTGYMSDIVESFPEKRRRQRRRRCGANGSQSFDE